MKEVVIYNLGNDTLVTYSLTVSNTPKHSGHC